MLLRRTFLLGLAGFPAVLRARPLDVYLPAGSPPFLSRPRSQAILSSAYPYAVQAGLEAMRSGGSAADGAIVTALCQLVLSGGAYVNLMGVGFGVLHRASDRACLSIHGGYQVPSGESGVAPPSSGGRTVLTPGFPAFLLELHRQLGRLPWSRLLEPAVWLARNGFQAGGRLADCIARDQDWLRSMEGGEDFFIEGKPLGARDVFRQPLLAESLTQLPDFYRGDLATRLVSTVQADGGTLSLKDLDSYQAQVSDALTGEVWGSRLATLAPPSRGGSRLLQACRLLEQAKLGGLDSPETVFELIRACRAASSSHSASIVAADREGNVVSILHSSNSTRDFGCSGLRVGGVVLPGSASFQWPLVARVGPSGHVPDPTNPNLIFQKDRVVWATGVIGSNLDRAMTRRLLDILYYRVDPERVAHLPCPGGASGSADRMDPLVFSADFLNRLERLGQKVERVSCSPDNWVGLERTDSGWIGRASMPELAWFAGE